MNQEKQREAYEKLLKKCPDILTPMKANRWSPVGKNTIYAALKNGEIESYTYKGGYIFTKDGYCERQTKNLFQGITPVFIKRCYGGCFR